jgi:hypothetical protein
MRRWIWIVILLVVTPALASAQTSKEHRWYSNVFLAPGIATDGDGLGPTLHVGVGFDRFLHRGFGIGGEIGYAGAATALGFGAALASVNGAYHFKRADKFVPFVTGGRLFAALSFGHSERCELRQRVQLLVSRAARFPPGAARSRRNPGQVSSCPRLAHWPDFSLILLIQYNQRNDYESSMSDFPINTSLDRRFVA